MRACELMAGRTDAESALLACGAVVMTLRIIVILGIKYSVVVGWRRIRLCLILVAHLLRLICRIVIDAAGNDRII